MYAAPNPAGTATKTALPVIAAICCGAFLLFLLAATIVLALIPIYTPTKTSTSSSTAGRSNPFTIVANAGSASSSGRKRDVSSVSDGIKCIGSKLSRGSLVSLQNKIQNVAKRNSKCKSIELTEATWGAQSSSKKRRFSLAKRQAGAIFIMIIKGYAWFADGCIGPCQNYYGAIIRSLIMNNFASQVSLTNVELVNSDGGTCAILAAISFLGVLFMSPLGSAGTYAAYVFSWNTISLTTASTTSTTASTVSNALAG